jgi:hypothetical protein
MLRNWNVDTFSIIDIIMSIIVIKRSSEGKEVHSEAEGYEGCAGAGAGRPWNMQRWICLQQSDLPTERAVDNVRIIDSPLRGAVRVLVTKTTG